MIDGRAAIRDTHTQVQLLTDYDCLRKKELASERKRFGSSGTSWGSRPSGSIQGFTGPKRQCPNKEEGEKKKKRKSRALGLHLHRGEYIKENGGGLIADSSFSIHYNQARPNLYASLSRPGLTLRVKKVIVLKEIKMLFIIVKIF